MENVVTSFHDGTWEGNDIFHGRTVLALQKGFDHCCLLCIGAVSHFDELEMYFIQTDLCMAQGFLDFLQNKKSPLFFPFGRHSMCKLQTFAWGLYSNEQLSEEETHAFLQLKGFSKKILRLNYKNDIRDACSTADILDCPRHAFR